MNDDTDLTQHDDSTDDGVVLPSANDVLAQQMGEEFTQVENLDKQELQKDLSKQVEGIEGEATIPGDSTVDDGNMPDDKSIGS